MNYVLVAIGAAIGGVLRYAIGVLTPSQSGFPWTTFGINIVGSFLLGIIIGLSSEKFLSEEVRLLLAVGFCGGFTTFSTFSAESLSLLQTKEYLLAFGYILSSTTLGIMLTYLGFKIGKT